MSEQKIDNYGILFLFTVMSLVFIIIALSLLNVSYEYYFYSVVPLMIFSIILFVYVANKESTKI